MSEQFTFVGVPGRRSSAGFTAQVHQHPDGHIYVRVGDKVYRETPENFAADFGSALPSLPAGVTERIYEAGVRHAISDGVNVLGGGPLPWPLGDEIIAVLAKLMERQTARDAALDAARAAERDAAAEAVNAANPPAPRERLQEHLDEAQEKRDDRRDDRRQDRRDDRKEKRDAKR